MAERRLFAKSIVMSDAFLDMSTAARSLYFAMGMTADDDGFVSNPKSLIRLCGVKPENLKELIDKRYVLAFDSGVVVIKHWNINNTIQKDRYHPTTYIEEFNMLSKDNKQAYIEKCIQDVSKLETDCIQNVSKMETEVKLSKVNISKVNKEKDKKESSFSSVCSQIIDYLNEQCGTKYRASSKATQRLINARFNDGFTMDDFKKVIDNVKQGWKGTHMEQYIRPETIFSNKFEGYLNHAPFVVPEKSNRFTEVDRPYNEEDKYKYSPFTKEQIEEMEAEGVVFMSGYQEILDDPTGKYTKYLVEI